LALEQQSIKFKLLTTFDRVTVESIFNFCKFETVVGEVYPFLKMKSKQFGFYPSRTGGFSYKDISTQLLDTKITLIERLSKTAQLKELINRSYGEKVTTKSVLLNYLIGNFGAEREILIDIIENSSEKIDVEELNKLIEFDIRQRNAR